MNKTIFVFLFLLICQVGALAQETIFYQEVSWSPDGKYFSCSVYRKPDPNNNQVKSEIYLMKTDGTNPQKIADDAAWTSWSKDGKRILFSRASTDKKTSDIFTVKKDGSDLIQLTKNAKQNTAPALSPDGKKIAFMSTRDGDKYQIYVMNADSSEVRKLTADSGISFCNPVWSKDGRRIVYYSDKGDRKDQIWIMNADGSNQTLLTAGLGHNIFPSFSPDGKRIIFSRRADIDADKSYVDASYLFTIKADGTKLSPIAEINSFFARFSPDGKKIAFVMGKFPANAIYVAKADGTNITKLTK